ncbi:hypothetical protein ACWEQ8_10640 [Streptomyces noursei]
MRQAAAIRPPRLQVRGLRTGGGSVRRLGHALLNRLAVSGAAAFLNRKALQRLPELIVEEHAPVDLFRFDDQPARIAVRPYYTADNDLSIVVTELAEGGTGG